jgi:type 1 glutamine amidotransferase
VRHYIILNILLLCGLALDGSAQLPKVKSPAAPAPRSRAEIEAVLAKAPKPQTDESIKHINIVLVADKKDHGSNEHDYPLWQQRWRILLSGTETGAVNLYGPPQDNPESTSGAKDVTVTTAWKWPDQQQFAAADVIVAFCYIDWDEQKLKQLQQYLKRGGGFVPVHPATWPMPKPLKEVAELTGCGGFTRYRHGPVKLTITAEDHPICLGLPKTIDLLDETYWPMTPAVKNGQIQVLAVSEENVSEGSAEMQPQPVFWTYRYGKGRVFGCMPGHYTWTFDDPYFRLLLLRGIAWSAGQWPYRFDSLATYGIALKD